MTLIAHRMTLIAHRPSPNAQRPTPNALHFHVSCGDMNAVKHGRALFLILSEEPFGRPPRRRYRHSETQCSASKCTRVPQEACHQGDCVLCAYPLGTQGDLSRATDQALMDAGYEVAFNSRVRKEMVSQ